jgi:hypothetical protein
MNNMKAKFLTTILLLISVMSFAQNQTSEHLTFKSVPIDGTLADYVTKMKLNGFTLILTKDYSAVLNGDFAGYKDCNVGVSTLKQKDLVHKIGVFFPKHDTWATLSGNYFNLKKMLIEKYGEPYDVLEKFDGDSQPTEDDDKMYKVKFDNCKYYSIWQTEKGDINLSIDHYSVSRCYVTLVYFDKINSEKIIAIAKDDL